jgi:hypothetical protein
VPGPPSTLTAALFALCRACSQLATPIHHTTSQMSHSELTDCDQHLRIVIVQLLEVCDIDVVSLCQHTELNFSDVVNLTKRDYVVR